MLKKTQTVSTAGIYQGSDGTMSIEVKFSPIFIRYTNNQQAAEVSGSTVGECLDHLVKQFPDLKTIIFDKHGKLHLYLDVYVNGESAYPEELVKPVKDGDTLQLIMVIAGG